MRYFSFVAFFLIVLMTNCSDKKNAKEADAPVEQGSIDLAVDVNRIHDEVMPRMGELYKLKKKLQALDTAASTTPDKKTKINAAIQKLDSAYDGMMTWMHQYRPEEHEGEDSRQYLESELEKIKTVKTDMLSAIATSEAVLGKQ